MRRSTLVVVLVLLVCWLASAAHAGRFFATPYAGTLPEGKYSIWHFNVYEERASQDWRFLNRVDVGLHEGTELSILTNNPPGAGKTTTWINAQHRLLEERDDRPEVSIGVWDMAGRASWFIAAGKNFKDPVDHVNNIKIGLNCGTERLNGLGGGADFRIGDDWGVMTEYMPTSMRPPGTDSMNYGAYYWVNPRLRVRASSMGGNPMLDFVWTDVIK